VEKIFHAGFKSIKIKSVNDKKIKILFLLKINNK